MNSDALQIQNIASQKQGLPNIKRFRETQQHREWKLKSILRDVVIEILGTKTETWKKFLTLVSEELQLPVQIQPFNDSILPQESCYHIAFEKVGLEGMTDIILFAVNECHSYLPLASQNIRESRARLFRQVERILDHHKTELNDLMKDPTRLLKYEQT